MRTHPSHSLLLLRFAACTVMAFAFSAHPLLAQEDEQSEMTWAELGDDYMPDYSRRGADGCVRCHGGDEDSAHLNQVFEGPHGVSGDGRTPFGEGQLQCEACHGPGGDHTGRLGAGEQRPPMPAFGPNAVWSETKQNEICMSCHVDQKHGFWEGGTHQIAEVGCADCHESHVRRDPMTIASTQNDGCLSCHVETRSQVNRAHSHPIRHGEMACTSCHAPHGAPNDAMLTQPTLNQSCYECHAEVRGPHLWEHAPVTENCSNCHQPHGSMHPGMLTQRAPLLCQSCHSRVGHAGIGRSANDLPGGNPSVFLLSGSCLSCHSQVHGSNHPSGSLLLR